MCPEIFAELVNPDHRLVFTNLNPKPLADFLGLRPVNFQFAAASAPPYPLAKTDEIFLHVAFVNVREYEDVYFVQSRPRAIDTFDPLYADANHL